MIQLRIAVHLPISLHFHAPCHMHKASHLFDIYWHFFSLPVPVLFRDEEKIRSEYFMKYELCIIAFLVVTDGVSRARDASNRSLQCHQMKLKASKAVKSALECKCMYTDIYNMKQFFSTTFFFLYVSCISFAAAAMEILNERVFSVFLGNVYVPTQTASLCKRWVNSWTTFIVKIQTGNTFKSFCYVL